MKVGKVEKDMSEANNNAQHARFLFVCDMYIIIKDIDNANNKERKNKENEREDQGEGVQYSGKTSTDVRGRYMDVEEGTGNEIGGCRNENATMDVRSYEAGQDKK